MLINQTCVTDDNEDIFEKNKKDEEYYKYIVNHIQYVKEAFMRYFYPLLKTDFVINSVSTESLKKAMIIAASNIKNHDASKFGDDEFDLYRAKYYPTLKEKNGDDEYQKKIEDEYELAWEHHYTCNGHHPKHWVNKDTGEKTDMPLEYIIEMICDWESISFNFNTNTLKWYENEAQDEKDCFTSTTKQIVEDILYNLIHK